MSNYLTKKSYCFYLRLMVTLLFLVVPVYFLNAQYFTKISNVITNDAADSRSVNWIDYDNDGDLDAYISNGHYPSTNAFLYENIGNGDFLKITGAAVAKNNTSADGSSWADYNNDGYLELYLVAWYGQRSYLYNNSGNGNFEVVTDGILGKASGFSESCSWGDYDNDGYVDLYVANSSGYLKNYFYHNDCGESFTKILTGNPATDKSISRTVNWIDYDNDGDIDLFVSNESEEPNNLYRNMLKETGIAEFEVVTNDPVVLSKSSSISSTWGDYDNDGDMDLFVSNDGSGEYNELFQNNGDGSFAKITEGIQCHEGGNSYGCNWADFDNDGDLDLFVTNAWGGSNDNFLYRNLLMETDTAKFEKISDSFVTKDGGWSYGSSWGDYDQDGDLDLLVAKWHNDASVVHNALFRNEIGNLNHWITIKCIGKISNASAIGAKIFLKATIRNKPVWQLREVSAQESYCSENLYSHFGLGDASGIDSIIVKWPSGIKQFLTNLDTNQFLTIVEDTLLFEGTKPTCTVPVTNVNSYLKNNFGNFEIEPNPAREIITIHYTLTAPALTNIDIYQMNGSRIFRIDNKNQQIGTYDIKYNTSAIPRGLYFIRFSSSEFTSIKKLVLID